jgi:hypothetical protein
MKKKVNESSFVFNCIWENRLYFAKQLGIDPQKKWVYRLKHRILGKAPANIAALLMNVMSCNLPPINLILNSQSVCGRIIAFVC